MEGVYVYVYVDLYVCVYVYDQRVTDVYVYMLAHGYHVKFCMGMYFIHVVNPNIKIKRLKN